MANEFVIKNGLIVLGGASVITGSLTVTNGVTGSLEGTASYALTASYFSGSITSASYALSASFASTASYALTASYLNTLNQDLIFNGNLTLNGTASITYLNVIYETASVIYSSGSNQLGDTTADTQTLIGKVITSGSLISTGSMYITGSIYNIDSIQFNTTSSLPTTVGGINWDNGTGTLNVLLKGGNIDLQVGQENVVLIHNGEGTTLNKGEVVYVSGSAGNRPLVKRASAISDGYSVTTLGFAAESITAGAEGYVTTFGILNNIDTSGTSGGDPVWLSPTVLGGWTTTKPQAPQHTVLLGYVVRVSSTVGSIFVHISNGWEIEELHNVRIVSDTDGDILVKSGSLWINSKQLTGSYGLTGSLSATSFTGSLFGTASQALTASYVNPLTQTVQITGSLQVSGSTSIFKNDAVYGIPARFEVGYGGNVPFVDTTTGNVIGIYPLNGSAAIVGYNYGAAGFAIQGTGGSALKLYTDTATRPVQIQHDQTYGNVVIGTTSDPGYKLFVSGSTGISNNLTVTGSAVSVGGFTGSLQGTSSWAQNVVSASFATTSSYVLQSVSASYATTASYVNGLVTKNNVVAAGAFSGNPRKATVTFTTAFPNTNYTITITGEDSRTWTIESKLAGSFVINSNSNVSPAGNTYWQAMNYGEFNG